MIGQCPRNETSSWPVVKRPLSFVCVDPGINLEIYDACLRQAFSYPMKRQDGKIRASDKVFCHDSSAGGGFPCRIPHNIRVFVRDGCRKRYTVSVPQAVFSRHTECVADGVDMVIDLEVAIERFIQDYLKLADEYPDILVGLPRLYYAGINIETSLLLPESLKLFPNQDDLWVHFGSEKEKRRYRAFCESRNCLTDTTL